MLELSSEIIFAFLMLAALVGISFSPDSFWFKLYDE